MGSLELLRAQVDKEIAQLARLNETTEQRRRLSRRLGDQMKEQLAAERLEAASSGHDAEDAPVPPSEEAAEQMWTEPPSHRGLLEGVKSSIDESIYLSASSPPAAVAAQKLEAQQAEQKKAEQKLDGWSSTAGPAFGRTSPQRSQRRVITPPWISAAGTSPRSVPLRGEPVVTDAPPPTRKAKKKPAAATAAGRTSKHTGRYRVLRRCRVRSEAALDSEPQGVLEAGEIIEVVARRTVRPKPSSGRADVDPVQALEAANRALDSLNKPDIDEILSYVSPPSAVVLVTDAVCVLLGAAPSWDQSKQLMQQADFLRRLREYDKDSLSAALLRKLRKYTARPDFEPERVGVVSKAAKSLALWARGIAAYAGAKSRTAASRAVSRQVRRSADGAAEKVVRLQFWGGWVSELTQRGGLRCLERLADGLGSTQPRRQAGVARHVAERMEASFYSEGVPFRQKRSVGQRPAMPLSPAQARRLGMPLDPTYSLAQLQAGAWRALQKSKGSCIDPTRLEASLSEEAFDEAFGMDKAAFARLPSFERKRRKAILMLV